MMNIFYKYCYGLKICVIPKICMLKPNPQCNGIWKCSLGGG